MKADVHSQKNIQKYYPISFEDRGTGSRAKEHRYPLESEKVKETDPPQSSRQSTAWPTP